MKKKLLRNLLKGKHFRMFTNINLLRSGAFVNFQMSRITKDLALILRVKITDNFANAISSHLEAFQAEFSSLLFLRQQFGDKCIKNRSLQRLPSRDKNSIGD